MRRNRVHDRVRRPRRRRSGAGSRAAARSPRRPEPAVPSFLAILGLHLSLLRNKASDLGLTAMSKVINLNKARKARAKAEQKARADENVILHGRNKGHRVSDRR